MVTGAAYYSQIIEDLFTALSELDTTGYQWLESDAWTQALNWDPVGTTQHLECWLNLGGSAELRQSMIRHAAELHIPIRFEPDDDAVSQGRMHAAIRAALDLLTCWRSSAGVRSEPTSFEITAVEGRDSWVIAVIYFTLNVPRN